MIPVGSVVNAAAIVVGSLIGCMLHSRFPERIRTIVFQGLGLCVLLIGFQMAFKAQNILVVLFSILLGGIIGELVRLDTLFERLGNAVKKRIGSANPKFTEGLVSASLIFCIGALAIVGSIEEGIRDNPTVLYTKSILDGFASIALASSFGSGVLFSAIPVLLYQGGITIGAGYVESYLSPLIIDQLSATGGLLIAGIGIILLEIKDIRIANLLPSLLLVPLLTWVAGMLPSL